MPTYSESQAKQILGLQERPGLTKECFSRASHREIFHIELLAFQWLAGSLTSGQPALNSGGSIYSAFRYVYEGQCRAELE